ncbi:uncharacterized protein A4U43_C04F29140 [Asparagus officinalis]|uniref:Uncharacterized protein n=1 Tax=Asparagus officinalis TaxID=4686 RepID=A0A5P1F4H5_ASPOF|nr:uncharacterized protein A4U43_C04F29140 [Asparagus officinalis]
MLRGGKEMIEEESVVPLLCASLFVRRLNFLSLKMEALAGRWTFVWLEDELLVDMSLDIVRWLGFRLSIDVGSGPIGSSWDCGLFRTLEVRLVSSLLFTSVVKDVKQK